MSSEPRQNFFALALFALGCAYCFSPWASAPVALVGGIALALTLGNPFPTASRTISKWALQVAVVLLGFTMDLNVVLRAGADGVGFALVSIGLVFALGIALQRALKVRPATSILVTTGTAICGGSAIAAISSVLDAPQEDVSVSIGTVFLLNAVALIVFPPLGHAFGLSPHQFGVWSGIAIHDVASVVGAAKEYGGGSLEIATAVKLSRVLYLIPITLIVAFWVGKSGEGKRSVPIPYFIGLFVLASAIRTYTPGVAEIAPVVKLVATSILALSLFLIGAGITRATLKQVGVRPAVQGLALWIFISALALAFVKLTNVAQ